MSLQPGWYVVANTAMPVGRVFEAVFHEPVSPSSTRESQWQRIKAQAANGVLCSVYDHTPSRSAYVFRP